MVKREDAIETSLVRLRDTDRQSAQPGGDVEGDDTDALHEGRYKPEMGTIVVNDYSPAPES